MRILLLLLAAGCGAGEPPLPDEGPAPALSGALLSYDPAVATAANQALLPPGFTTPQQTVCAADVTRAFLAELIQHGISNPQVPYEWAPIVPSADAAHPTIGQPEFFVSGTVASLERSALDFRAGHPFGFDTTPDLQVDAPFVPMVYNRVGDPIDELHTEIESGLFPDATFGLTPTIGDRMLYKGSWIFDCGHPPYEAEMHPPTFAAVARADGAATMALAFANPYRTTQLYGPPTLTTQFDSATRYSDPEVKPFTGQLETQIFRAASGQIDHFELHALVEATRFDPITWFVCAPAPRPSATATLGYSYRFVTRTGVTVTAATRGDSGCLAFHAEMGAGYQPFVPKSTDYAWTWDEINSQASGQIGQTIDVRLLALDALTKAGITGDITALHSDAAIIVDQYAPLAPHAGASADSPTEIIAGADDQPFPFYGRARVFWK
jgi:hypothetical protein